MEPEPVALEDGEHVLGRWRADYLPPCGQRYPGQLSVTDRRVIFEGRVNVDHLRRIIAGPIDARAVAYALDLDDDRVAYAQDNIRLLIPKGQIECVQETRHLLNHGVSMTLKNNGSVHTFETGVQPAAALVRAIRHEMCPAP